MQNNAIATGRYLTDGLADLAGRHDVIGDIRGTGFFKAVELVGDCGSKEPDPELTANVVNALRNHGVLTGSIGVHDNILKLRPAMVFSRNNADFFLQVLDDVLSTA